MAGLAHVRRIFCRPVLVELHVLEIRSGCRLHFGLMELAEGAIGRYAGLGLMLAGPQWVLRFEPQSAPTTTIAVDTSSIEDARRATEITARIQAVHTLQHSDSPTQAERGGACRIVVRQALPLHSGLGAGTQLACTAAVGLALASPSGSEGCRLPTSPAAAQTSATWSPWQPVQRAVPGLNPRWLVRMSGRGLRSAVGVTGFLSGGLVLDEGYGQPAVAELSQRPLGASTTHLPARWRVVLIVPQPGTSMHGQREADALRALGHTPHPRAAEMKGLARSIQNLASHEDQFAAFTAALEGYMQLGAELFRPFQLGLYNGPEVTAAVEAARAVGLRGVGQSSWGPTVFGFAPDASQAQRAADELAASHSGWQVSTARPADSGAEIRWCGRSAEEKTGC